jgi:hypothetical protein
MQPSSTRRFRLTLGSLANAGQRLGELQSALLGAALSVACGGADYHAPPSAEESGAPSVHDAVADVDDGKPTEARPGQSVSITQANVAGEVGVLELRVVGALGQSLGSLEFAVRDRAGAVLSHGFNTVQGADSERRLLLQLPAGTDYDLVLSSSSPDDDAPTCHAHVPSFAIEPHATASLQTFVWECDATPQHAALADDCYWLASWVLASRTRAAVGQSITLGVSGADLDGAAPRVDWTNAAPSAGSLLDSRAASTSFQCAGASDSIPLTVTLSDGGCSRPIALSVACF